VTGVQTCALPIYYSNKLITLRIYINCLISCVFEGNNFLVCRVETSLCATSRKRLRNTVLDSRLIDGGKVVSLTRRLPFTPRKISGAHFCQRLIRSQGHSAAGRVRYIEKSDDLIGT
jgi:hypothetical protein